LAQARHGEHWIQPMAEEDGLKLRPALPDRPPGQARHRAAGVNRQLAAEEAEEVSQLTIEVDP
jgi:hypothetical protein